MKAPFPSDPPLCFLSGFAPPSFFPSCCEQPGLVANVVFVLVVFSFFKKRVGSLAEFDFIV